MAQPVGIQLVLKENIADRLGKVLPILDKMEKTFQTLNKTLNNLEASQKRVDKNFQNIGRSVDMVSQKERGLRNVNTGLQGIGGAANRAAGNLKGLVSQLGLVLGAYKLMQLGGAGVGDALRFQDTKTAVRQAGFSQGMTNRLAQRSLDLTTGGGSILSAEQLLEAAKGSKAFFGSEQDVYEALPEYSRVASRARKAKVELSQPEVLGRIWELMNKNVGPVKDRVSFDNQLLAVMSATSVTPQQLLYQMSVAGGSLAGSDPIDALRTLAYMTKESGAGIAGAGGGGRGRAGQRFAAIKDLARGQMPVAVAKLLYESGHMPGLGKYLESQGSTSTSTMVIDPHGMHRMGGRGKHGSHITKSALNQYFMEDAPPWAIKGQEDTGAIISMLVDTAAQRKHFKGNEIQRIQQFQKLGTGEQAQALGAIGLNRQVSMAVVQLTAGKFKTSVDNFQKAIDEALKLQDKDTGPKSMQQTLEELGKRFESLMNALGNNQGLITSTNKFLSTLNQGLDVLNQNLGPIASALSALVPKTGEQAAGAVGGAVVGGAAGGIPGAAIGSTVGGYAGVVAHKIMHEVDKIADSPAGKAVRRWGEKNFAPAHYAHGVKYGNFLVPPPPVGTIGPGLYDENGKPLPNITTPIDMPATNIVAQKPSPVHHTFTPPDASHSATHGVINLIQNFHPWSGTDHDKAAKAAAKALKPHLDNAHAKSALQYSNSGSKAGGSYTDQSHNDGGGQSH